MNMIFKTAQIKFEKPADRNHEYVRMFISPNSEYTYGYLSKSELVNHYNPHIRAVPVITMNSKEASLLAASYKLTKSLHEALLHALPNQMKRIGYEHCHAEQTNTGSRNNESSPDT